MKTKLVKYCDLKVKDVDAKQGIVKFYFAAFGNKDSQGDIIAKGAYSKTIKENKDRIKHFANHQWIGVGKVMALGEDEHGAWAESKMSMSTLGRDTLIKYEEGLITEHSQGFNTIKYEEDKKTNTTMIKEVQLWEVSSLDGWGANERTPVIDMKNFSDEKSLLTLLHKLNSSLRNSKLSDEGIIELTKQYEELKSLIENQPSVKDTDPNDEPTETKESAVKFFIDNLK